MERGSKRKAATLASPDVDGRAVKRLKSPNGPASASASQTVENTTQRGLQFITALKSLKDKSGREIIGEFLTLPDRKLLPDYYMAIKLPIAIKTIEDKLNRRAYPDLSALESDVKRMISNAKQFNEPRSEIFQDAERIRKSTSNWMTKANPAYQDPNYQAFPTPLPEDANTSGNGVNGRRRSTTKGTTPDRSARSASATVLNGVGNVGDSPYVGKTFQQAQLQIVDELINYEEDGLAIFTVFLNLPGRHLHDYYQVITHPTSLNSVKKRVKGNQGRGGPTSTTELRSWDAFETEMGRIWQNARTYNEDGSEIFELAGLFEDLFKSKLAEARKTVKEPTPPPSLKLYHGSKPPPPSNIKLKLQSQKPSPSPQLSTQASSPAPSINASNVKADQAALQRQNQSVQAALNGTSQTSGAKAASAISLPLATAGIKAEANHSQSPHLNNSVLSQPGLSSTSNLPAPSMPPPPPRVASGSPYPQTMGQPSQPFVPPAVQPPPPGFDSRFRPPWKDVTSALMQNLQVSSHPSINLPKPYEFNIRPDEELAQYSVTLNVPGSHYYMQLKPTLVSNLTTAAADGTPPRPYKMFVTVNGHRLQPSRMQVPEGQQVVYDLKLALGVNRVEVECVTEKTKEDKERFKKEVEKLKENGNVRAAGAELENLEMEKCSLFLNLLRPIS